MQNSSYWFAGALAMLVSFLDEAPDFFVHLQEERGLRPGRLDHYDFYLHSLGLYLREIGVTPVNELSAPILRGFITAQLRASAVRLPRLDCDRREGAGATQGGTAPASV